MLKPEDNVTEQASVIGIRQLVEAGVELTPDERREHIHKWLLCAGFTVLEESDVVDMGEYVIPREVSAGATYVIKNDTVLHYAGCYNVHDVYTDDNVSDNVRRKRTVYVGGKPLRIEGAFEYPGAFGVEEVLVLRNMWGSQVEMHIRCGRGVRPVYLDKNISGVSIPEGAKQVEYATLGPKDKKSVCIGIRELLPHAMHIKYSTLLGNLDANRKASMHAMVGNDILYRDNTVYKWRAHLNVGSIRTLRSEITKPLAALLKRSIDGDLSYDDVVNEVVKLLGTRWLSTSVREYLTGVWNANCHSSDEVVFGECGHVFHQDDGHGVGDGSESVCDACFEEHYVWVEDLDEYRHSDTVYHHDSDDNYYSYPEEDDDYDDDDGRSGLSSWGASTEYLKHDNSFTPSSTGDFTMGIELEVEATEYRKDRVRECHDYFNRNGTYAMFKSDGSLDSRLGFEIVTAARRLVDHVKMFKEWQPVELTSWDAGNCGMHVHIDSRAFTPLTLGKFLMFFNSPDNAQFIRDIAGRHPKFDDQAVSYANTINKSYVHNPGLVKKSSGDNSSRYRMVNVTNLTDSEQSRLGLYVERQSKGSYSTIEVRIFRGTLRKARLLAQIEFAHAAVAFCRVASWQEMDADAFKHWLSITEGYPNLRRWYGVSRARNKNNTEAAQAAEVEEI